MSEWRHPELAPAPAVDRAALDLIEVLAHISASIRWLSALRDKSGPRDLGLHAVRVQVELVSEYRQLLNAVDAGRRIQQGEETMARIQGDLERRSTEDT